MFAFELATATPCGSAPYYSLVVRDPYIIGSHPAADIAINDAGISMQHVSLTVLHAHEAEKEIAAATQAAGAAAATATAAHNEEGNVEEEEEEEEEAAAGHEHHIKTYADAVRATPKNDDDSADRQSDNDNDEARKAGAPYKPAAAAGANGAGDVDGEDEEAGDVPADVEEVRAPATHDDRLVVRVTALPTKGDGEVRIGGVRLQPGDSVVVRDGDVLYLGDGVSGTFHYRPLMVGLEAGTYPDDYVADLRRMFDQLGATFVEEPISSQDLPHVPIGQLFCAEELNDSTSCLAALAYGYSVVQPTYVFEWFAAVSKRAAAPLSSLLSPARFEVPVRCTTHPTTTTYLRPESDTCPFSLFPIPNTAMTNRSRAELFAGRVFFFFTDAAATRYWRAVEDCGGAVYGPGDVEAAKEAIRRLVEAQQEAGLVADRLPNNFYIIIDNTSEAVLLNSGLEAASPELLAFMNDTGSAYGATNLCVMGDHSLFTALLCNRFCEEPVQLTSGVPMAAVASYNDPADAFGVPPLPGRDEYADDGAAVASGAPVSVRTPRSSYSPRLHSTAMSNGNNNNNNAPATARSASRASERRNSLLPRTANRTPSRSQLRSFSRQRARSASIQGGSVNGSRAGGNDGGSFYGGAGGSTSARSGRRHLVPSVIEGEMRSFAEDFDMTRVRIYAFLVREEPKLDRAIATYHRNFYVNTEGMEYALEIKAQAEDFMERVDDLLADPACHGAYTESLRRFWRDCSDMDVKAQHLLHCWDRSYPAASLPRRCSSTSRRASSAAATSRRAASSVGNGAQTSRSVTPRGVVSVANSPAPARSVGSPDYHQQPHRDPADMREHRDLYMSPEAAQRLQENDRVEEHPFTQEEVSVLRSVQQQQQQRQSSSAAPGRGASASSRQSHRRSRTPRSRVRSVAPVPIDQRPPWNPNFAEPSENGEEAAQHKEGASTAASSQQRDVAARDWQSSKTPRAVQLDPAGEVAPDTPSMVHARTTGRSAAKADHADDEEKDEEATDLHETVMSDNSVKFAIEENGEAAEEEEQAHATHTLEKHGDDELTDGTIDYTEEPITHAANLDEAPQEEQPQPQKHEAEAEEEDVEAQVRTAPAPTPQPAPAARPRKPALPDAARPRAKSASASKRTEQKKKNGAAANGKAHSKAKADAQPEKPRAVKPWRF